MLFKLSNLNSNLALTLGYLNPALKNSALVIIAIQPLNKWGNGSSQTRFRILLTGYVDRFIFSLILTEFRGIWLEIGRNSHQKRGSLYSRKLPFVYLCRS